MVKNIRNVAALLLIAVSAISSAQSTGSGGGGPSGSATQGQVTTWGSSTSVTGDPNFTWKSGTLVVDGGVTVDGGFYAWSAVLGNPLPIGSGGSGQPTANAALNAYLPSQGSANGKCLVSNGTNTSWSACGSGSLNSLNTYAAYASRPDAGTSGNTFTCSNCAIANWVDDGAAWHPIIVGVVGTQPKAAATFTPVNQGSSTLTDQVGSLHLTIPLGGGASNIRSYVETISASSTLHAEMAFSFTVQFSNGLPNCSVILRESTTSKIYACGSTVSAVNGLTTQDVWYQLAALWTNDTTKASQTAADFIIHNAPLFYRARRNGATVFCDSSNDNVNWYNISSTATTTAFTTAPNQTGLACSEVTNDQQIEADFVHYNSGA